MLSSAKLMFEVMTDLVAEGNFINTPLANVRPSISGVFANAADGFDPSRHVKGTSLSAGLLLGNKMRNVRVEKVLQPVPASVLIQFEDVASQTTGGKLTPCGIGSLSGEELKFDPANAAEGIYFIAEDGAESKVTSVAQRTEGRLIFSIPGGLAAGQYQLEIRKGYKVGQGNKEREPARAVTGELTKYIW
jgi:hypothetical protein